MTRRGTVLAFDEQLGLGTIAVAGGGEISFHCVSIADGSRTIPVGSTVRYRLRGGVGGRWEAADVMTMSPDRRRQDPSA